MPPGSACSIQFGVGLTDAPPGFAKTNHLVVSDLVAARGKLIERGVAVSEIRHKHALGDRQGAWAPGIEPNRRDYASCTDVLDPDGNGWILQERGFHGAV